MEDWVRTAASFLSILCEGIATLVIAIAIVRALVFAVKNARHPTISSGRVRVKLGRGLTVALEFLLAADILRTAVAPTWNEIGKLGAIAVLRTALNYFLEREIRGEEGLERGHAPSASPAKAA